LRAVLRATTLVTLGLLSLVFFSARVEGALPQDYSFTFAAGGDHGDSTRFRLSLDSLNQSGASFYLALGDLAYSSVEQAWCQQWLTGSGNPSGKSFKNILLLAGNHDSGEDPSGNINLYTQSCGLGPLAPSDFTSSPSQTAPQNGCEWPDATRRCYGKEYYFDWPISNPIARFIMISPQIDYNVDNGERWVYDTQTGRARYDFASNAIDSARALGITWIIVGTHKVHLESDASHSSGMGAEIFNLLVEKKVDLLLQGHVHNYERTSQLAHSTTCPAIDLTYNATCVANQGSRFYKDQGTIVAITGSFGRSLTTIASEPDTPYFQSLNDTTWGFTKISLSRLRLDAQFVATSGGAFTDNFTILATDTYGFQFDWADYNNDGRVDILDVAQAAEYFDEICVSLVATPRQCYWDLDIDGMVSVVDIARIATLFDIIQLTPYLGQGRDEYNLDPIFAATMNGPPG